MGPKRIPTDTTRKKPKTRTERSEISTVSEDDGEDRPNSAPIPQITEENPNPAPAGVNQDPPSGHETLVQVSEVSVPSQSSQSIYQFPGPIPPIAVYFEQTYSAPDLQKKKEEPQPGPSSATKSILRSRPPRAVSNDGIAASSHPKDSRPQGRPSRSEAKPAGVGRLSSVSSVRVIQNAPSRPTRLNSSSSASSVQYTQSGRYKIKNPHTSELYQKFLEKERRRQAGVIVTSSTSSTVDENELGAQIRRKRLQRPFNCCHYLERQGRRCRFSCCMFAQDRLYRFPCFKYKKRPWTDDEIHDMTLMWKYCGRTSNSASFIATLYRHASLANIPKGRIDSFKQRTVALRNTHLTLRHLDRAVTLTKQVVDRLSISEMYFPFPPKMEIKRMVHGRSIIGTYVWLATYALRFFDIPKRDLVETYAPYHKIWMELFTSSTAMYSGICHMFISIKGVLKKFESFIRKYTINIRPYTTTGERPPIEIIKFKEEVKLRETWRKEKQRLDKEIRYYKCRYDLRKPVPEPPLLNVIMKYEGTQKHWYDFDNLYWREQVKTLIFFFKHAKTTCDDSFGMLKALDREMFHRRKKKKRRRRDPRCVYRGVHILRKLYKSFHAFPYNMIKPSEVLEFNECARIMLDKIDQFYVQLYQLKDLAREAQLMIQQCYEYVRTVYLWPFPSYVKRFNKLHHKFMLRWAHHEMFSAREWAINMNSAEALFHTSPYQVLIRLCPPRIGRLLLSVETPSEATANRQPRDDDPEMPNMRDDYVHTLDDAIRVPLRGTPALTKRIKDKAQGRKFNIF